jgi:indole-3-glycerol phosphate synthase
MSATYLDDIMRFHRARAAADTRVWQERLPVSPPHLSLRRALLSHRDQGIAVIAEIKRRSPSKGWLAPDMDAVATALAYQDGGASGVSVLTDEPHFGGTLADLADVSAAVTIPTLRKDFVVSANDLIDGVDAGASCVLLIAAALSSDELQSLILVARQLRVDVLVEVHTADEARHVTDCGADLIGVNQRDLRSFAIDPRRAEEVVAVLSPATVAVAESGFSSRDAVRRAAESGFDAVLVGETFVTAPSPRAAVADFVGAPIGVRTT